jgi:hypothetical protein
MYTFVHHNSLLINEDYLAFLKESNLADFGTLKNLQPSAAIKETRYRSVVRIVVQDRIFYIKRHFWPLKEKLLSCIPWMQKEDAANEWENIVLLNSLGINTMTPVAFGEEKILGVPVFSLTVTDNLYETEKMKPYLKERFARPLSADLILEKRAFIKKLASFARDFHNKGFNHQDFNLGHLYYRTTDEQMFVTDVQRTHQRKSIRFYDRIKDLAQLAYSASGAGVISRTDCMRFAHEYFLRQKMEKKDKKIIRCIVAKMARIARHDEFKRNLRRKKKGLA